MEIHEVVYHATLQVILYAVDDNLTADVHNLQIGIVAFVTIAVNGFVHLFVILDPVTEVQCCLFRVLAFIIRTRGLDVSDIGHYQVFVIAFGLDEQYLDALARANVHNPFTPVFCGVCCVQDPNDTSLLEPAKHIRYRGLCSSLPPSFALGIAYIEEVGRRLRRIVTPVIADVEGLGVYRKPL